jgi:phosphatidylserine/phosphatidylglycerophosphate/cardiolipin synthase-like enzyme
MVLPLPPSAAPQPATQAIQVFFTTPTLVYPDRDDWRMPPPHEEALLADIDAAQHSIEIATFEYNLVSLADALLRAQQRGVGVRLALDREVLVKPEQSLWAGRLEAAGIPIAWEQSAAFLHSKFAVIDRRIVWTGSWNMTSNGTYRNNNNILRISAPPIVENYAAEFEQMSAGTFGTSKASLSSYPIVEGGNVRIENYFAPQDGVAAHILLRLQQARHTIRFLAFAYTSDDIAQAMLERQAAGVQVQGVFESRNARGSGSQFAALRDGGAEVLEDGNCYTMHHKVIIIDDATVITGSYNFTGRAEDTNDENLLIIDDAGVAQQFLREFERVYAQALYPTRCTH